MAIYRAGEVHKMSPKERSEKLDELRAELLREHGVKAAGGAPKNPGRIRALRKTIARILTIAAAGAASEATPRRMPLSTPPRPPSPKKGAAGKAVPEKVPAKKAARKAPRRKT